MATFELEKLDDLSLPPGCPDEWEVSINESVIHTRAWWQVSAMFQRFLNKGRAAGYVMTAYSDASNRRFIFHGKRASTALPEPPPTKPQRAIAQALEILTIDSLLPTNLKPAKPALK